jgi:imidazole glycerol-phosphate synthase subunit HisF
MLRPRVIPLLLIKNKGLVKSIKFSEYKYVGDPINAVRIFNEKKVDELMMIDIDATSKSESPNFEMIKLWASECRMPLCYGGGIKTLDDAQKIFALGVEKIALSSEAISNPLLVKQISDKVGSQSVVVVLDVKKNFFGNYEIYTHNAKKLTKVKIFDFIQKLEKLGVGEIIINSIDRDGLMKGYDILLAKKVREKISIPITILGGAGNYEDIKQLVNEFKIIGAGAGSLFVFKGKYKAVLINYLSDDQKNNLIS